MAVNVIDVQVLDNPSPFLSPFQFQISFECITELSHDLEWKLVYVGSAEDKTQDQVLDTVEVGPLQMGLMKFIFQVDPPDASKIPAKDLLEVTAVLLSCSYRGQDFIRVGYYVMNQYTDPELRENPPATPILDKIQRSVMTDHPRVTKWQIQWDDKPTPDESATNEQSEQQQQQDQQQQQEQPDAEMQSAQSVENSNSVQESAS
eukprot:c9623_g1_i3.p1 GENE.c9623_g1_i3~~c9623_g1_i3.p1  ORF type:complete len:213 (+),score=42.96 c9623_g1_i3:29-640(+)